MNKYGIKELIAAFGYDKVLVGGEFFNEMPARFLDEMRDYLGKLAGWPHQDNKTAFLFEGTNGEIHLISFWDGAARHISWYSRFNGTDGCFTQCVVKGNKEVKDALLNWKKGWKLWLDDQLNDPSCPVRHVPEGFIGAKTSAEAIQLVRQYGLPGYMDLDHDLGQNDDTMIFLKWLVNDFQAQEVPDYKVHSRNTVGAENIISYIESWKKVLKGEKK